jgi:hypothetical protein
MNVCKRALAGLALLLSAAGLLLGLGGGVGVWVVKGPATAKATWAFERINGALEVADQSLGQVQASLARAAERLEGVREEQKRLTQGPRTGNPLRRVLARTVQQQITPDVSAAHEKLHTVAEAAVVVNSVLEDLGSFTPLSAAGLDLGRLTELNGRLAEVGPAAWELSRLLGEPETSSADASAQLSRVDQALGTMRRSVADYELQLAQVRQRTEALRSRVLTWVTPAAALVSFACFWVALSQVSLLSHAWSWWKCSGAHK